jgi:tRNA threonylcarbamoyladenosine biosynthesis protein TsaB
MTVLTLRTDKPDAEIALYDAGNLIAQETWLAHRKLAETIHTQVEKLLRAQRKEWNDLQGIVVFEGPGSFTGLRIGISTANAIAYSLAIPIVATRDEAWATKGVERLLAGEQDEIALPFYGGDANITAPRK